MAQLTLFGAETKTANKTIKPKRKRSLINVVRNYNDQLEDLIYHYAEMQINSIKKKGINVDCDLKSEIYSMVGKYFASKTIVKVKDTYKSTFGQDPHPDYEHR